jgi:hypothetical protein
MSRRDIKHSDPISVIGYNGRGHIKYPLKGYDNEHFTITCEYKRGWGSKPENYWHIDYEIPRWGRNEDVSAKDSLTDLRSFMDEAILKIEELNNSIPELEKHRKIGEADRQAKRDREEAEKQAKIDADKPVGMSLAKAICDQMVKQARDTKEDSQAITFQTRGARRSLKMRCIYTYTGLTLFNCDYNRVSRKDAMAKLANAWIDSVDTGDVADSIPNAKMAAFMMGGLNK